MLDDVPFELDLETLLGQAHIEPGTEDAKEFEGLLGKAQAAAKPKAVCRECYIEARGKDTVTLEGVTFTSRALRANLDQPERVFAYVATCGKEVAEVELPAGDFLQEFWLDTIKETLLGVSTSHLNDYLSRQYALGKTATMHPGSGDATVWPIEQQKELFSLFGDVEDLIGVRLTDSFLMMPNKSVSGIRFPTEIDFQTCRLCHREECPSRAAPFDQELWDSIQHD